MFQLNPKVNFKSIDEESIVLSREKAMIFSLNHTATDILMLLQKCGTCSFDDIIDHLLLNYDVNEKDLIKDVAESIQKFVKLNIVLRQ